MERKSKINVLLSLSLLLCFVICAFFVLLQCISGYSRQIESNNHFKEIHTPIAYISTAIRSNDRFGEIQVLEIEGKTCLVITNALEQTNTVIYEDEGELKELYLMQGVSAKWADGEVLFKVKQLELSQEDDYISIALQDNQGKEKGVVIRLRSSSEVAK